ncbi:MAG: S24 family peptidase [Dysgonomonas sp.]|nr:S24 family peptidase [Dysgonomonas sp.]
MNDAWDRLEKVIKSTDLSINKFAESIGLKRSENLYRIKKGKNSISKDLAEIITIKYCNFSKSWLLTGEGTMYANGQEEAKTSIKKIPFYDSIILDSDGVEEMTLKEPLYYIEVPTLANCDLAALFVGESMKPEIPSGAIVTLKEIALSQVLPGEMYMIVTDKYTTIKYVRNVTNNDSLLRLIPKNTEAYDEMLLDKSFVRRLFLVKGVISTKVM